MDIPAAIKKIRKIKNYSQEVLAKKAMLSKSYLSLIEHGKRDLNISLLEKLAKGLDISLPMLIFIASESGDIPELSEELNNKIKLLAFNLLHE